MSALKPKTGQGAKPTQPRCNKCSKNVTAVRFPGLSCCSCKNYFHSSCAGLTDDSLSTLLDSGAEWSCSGCRKKSTTRKSIIILPASSIEETAKQTNSDKIASLDKILDDIRILMDFKTSTESSQAFYSDKFDQMKLESDKVNGLLTKVKSLELENAGLRKRIESLEDRLAVSEQDQNSCNLLLTGIPEVEDSEKEGSTTDLVMNFSSTVGACLQRTDLKSCVRLIPEVIPDSQNIPSTSKNSNPRPPKILLKFHSSKIRDSFKLHVRNFKKNCKILDFMSHRTNYYVSDQLTKHFNGLFCSVKSFASERNFDFVWVNNSKIFIKRSLNDPVFCIQNNQDFGKFKQSFFNV